MTLNQLLVEMDGFNGTSGVIVIGATNFPQSLDHALTRPGRFDRTINVPLPDIKGRIEILKVHLQKVKVSKGKISPAVHTSQLMNLLDLDISAIARGCAGMSGADLANLVNQAAIKGATDGKATVDTMAFEYAKDKILMGPEKKTLTLSDKEKQNTAFHEAGHALVALLTEGAKPIHKATIMPRGHSLGAVHFRQTDDGNDTKQHFLAQLDVSMGGRCAEELVHGSMGVSAGCSSDFASATRLARAMCSQWGMSEAIGKVNLVDKHGSLSNCSSGTRTLIESEVKIMCDVRIYAKPSSMYN